MRGGFRAIGVIVSAAVISTAVPSFSGVCAAGAADKWIEPVQGEIVRRFEEPLGPYAAGHRGLDFSVPIGTEVVASGSGRVTFAGPVAGDGYFVTIAHEAQLETTYSFMSTVTVVAGQKVDRGEAVGASGNGHPEAPAPVLHFGVKLASVYIDPEILLYADPTDISNIISLAPLEDPGAEGDTIVQNEGSPLRRIDFKAPKTGGGFFAGVGEGIGKGFAAAFDWIKEAPGNFFDWLKSTGTGIKDGFVNASQKAGEILGAGTTRIGNALADAGKGIWKAIKWGAGSAWTGLKAAGHWTLKAVKSFSGWVWTGVKAAIRWMDRVTQAAAMAIDRAAHSVAEGLRDLWRYAKALPSRLRNWLAGKAHGFADLFNPIIDKLKDSLIGRILPVRGVLGLIQGLTREVACRLEGGATPPKLPTAEDLKKGVSVHPPNDNIVVAVAGLGSSTSETADGVTTTASVYQGDWEQLGYEKGDVYHFSYKGIQNRGSNDEYALHAAYSKQDTYKSIAMSAKILDEQIREIHRKNPNRKIDIVAHSQGGLVAQHYVTRLYNTKNETGLDVAHFVSIATPHQGADLAQLHARLSDSDTGRQVLSELGAVATKMGWPPPSSDSTQEMAEKSEFIQKLNADWDPNKVPTTTIAASYDLIVTAQHTRLEGASHFTSLLDRSAPPWDGHGKIVNSMATKQIVYNTLAGTPSRCTGFRDFKAEFISGETISNLEDGLVTIVDVFTGTETGEGR